VHHIKPNSVVVQSAIATAAVAVRPDIAVRLLRQNAHHVTVIGYNAALFACAKAADYQLALDIYANMTKVDSITIGTVMAACEAAGQWEQVLDLADDPLVDCLGLTSALHACQQLAYGEAALSYLDRMKQLQVETTGQVATACAPAYSYPGQRRSALQGPDRVAYRLAISACARSGLWKDGVRLLKEYTQLFGGDALAYTAVMTGLEYAGEWQAAVSLLAHMRRTHTAPTDATYVSMLGACANALAKNAKDDAPKRTALALLQTLRNGKDKEKDNDDNQADRLTTPVYNAVIRVCAEALDLKNAMRTFDEMLDDGLVPTIVTFGTLMTAAERTANMNYMHELFHLMDRVYNVPPNAVVYGAAISCCRKSGQAKAAYHLYQRMQDEQLDVSTATLNTVLAAMVGGNNNNNNNNAMIVKGDLDRALEMVAQRNRNSMSDGKDNNKGSTTAANEPPNRQTYGIVIRAMAAARRPRDAEFLLKEMRQLHNMMPDVDLYTATVASYERSGQPLRALRLLEEMRAEGYDFYEASVLNAAFKSAIKVANAVGQRIVVIDDE
jgi:pentatricopeptide repeat protein